jgi:hypothetical protein
MNRLINALGGITVALWAIWFTLLIHFYTTTGLCK